MTTTDSDAPSRRQPVAEAQGRQAEALQALREPFPPDQISQLPKAGVKLDYVGHSELTRRLLDVDPFWNWEPLATDERGYPVLDYNDKGQPIGMWIKLTVAGVTRLGYGSTLPKPEGIKELIGDALRNAAMRFGAALDLWSKSDRAEAARAGDPVHKVMGDLKAAAAQLPGDGPLPDEETVDLTPLIDPLSQSQKQRLKKWWGDAFAPGVVAAEVPKSLVPRATEAIERFKG